MNSNSSFDQEKRIIHQLEDLKHSEADYPADLLRKRRTSYSQAVMGLSVPVSAGGLLKAIARFIPHGRAAILRTILVSALVVEAGVGAYYFRDQIKAWLLGIETPVITTPTLTTSPYSAHPQPTITDMATGTAVLSSTPSPTPTPTETMTITATGTALRIVEPTERYRPSDQGNHYGQTKTPKP